MGVGGEYAACTLCVLVSDLRYEGGQFVALHLHGLIDTGIDAFVISRVPLAQMLMQLVARVFKHLSTVEQLQPSISKLHDIYLGPPPWCMRLSGVQLHHRALELATQLRTELALVMQSTNALQGLVRVGVYQVRILRLTRLHCEALVVRLQI